MGNPFFVVHQPNISFLLSSSCIQLITENSTKGQHQQSKGKKIKQYLIKKKQKYIKQKTR